MKGHSFPRASRHQHPGTTRNEPKHTAGSRATGQGPPAQLCPAHRPLTRHRRLPHCPTEPRDKGAPQNTKDGVDSEKDSGRLRGGRTEATATPTVGPQTPPAETGRLWASWLPRGANTEEQPDTRGMHRRMVSTRVWDGAQLGPPEQSVFQGLSSHLDTTLRRVVRAAGGLREHGSPPPLHHVGATPSPATPFSGTRGCDPSLGGAQGQPSQGPRRELGTLAASRGGSRYQLRLHLAVVKTPLRERRKPKSHLGLLSSDAGPTQSLPRGRPIPRAS